MKDQETLRAELEKQYQQQEKRLTSMADANMTKLKEENEAALRNLRSNMESQARSLQARNSDLESQISSLMAELNKPRPGMVVHFIVTNKVSRALFTLLNWNVDWCCQHITYGANYQSEMIIDQ